MTPFDSLKALRWRDTLSRYLRKSRLRSGFDAIHRILTGYQGVHYPSGRYADEEVTSISGEFHLELNIARPRDPQGQDDFESYLSGPWDFWQKMFGIDSHRGIYKSFLLNYELKDQIWQQDLAPRVASNFAKQIRVYIRRKGVPDTAIDVDVTLASRYRAGRSHTIMFRTGKMHPGITRADITGIRIEVQRELRAGSISIVNYSNLRYRTAFGTFRLGSQRSMHDDLKVGEGVFFNVAGLSLEEERNPRQEDLDRRRELLRHLNEFTEYYHRIIWWTMDSCHRFMLPDGFMAPHTNGRSVASVVENRVIDIIGNCLVMPVAPGYQLDPSVQAIREKAEGEDEAVQDLLSLYRPVIPPDPYRISLPTKEVLAEAVLGACNACEKRDDRLFWRWEEEPCPDQPTPIESTGTASRRTTPTELQPTEFPSALLQIQRAPTAPAVMSLGELAKLLG